MAYDNYLGRVLAVLSAIVGVALAFTLVSSKNTATIINALGNAFAGSLRASMGR